MISMQRILSLKLVRKFGFILPGLKKGFLRSCCIIGWHHIELLKSLRQFIFAYVLTPIRKSLLQYMPIE